MPAAARRPILLTLALAVLLPVLFMGRKLDESTTEELTEALIVNPYHAHDTARAMHRALIMPPGEQEARMRQMRALVRTRNVYRWAGQMLLDAAQLRRREAIETLAASNAPEVTRLIEKRRA